MGEAFIVRRGAAGGGGKGVPIFSYSGTYEVVDDADLPISPADYDSAVFWKIRFLTSGTLSISELKGAKKGIDVFLVGGGGGGFYGNYAAGGGGGYTKTVYGKTISAGSIYPIIIGAGGAGGRTATGTTTPQDGNETSAFSEIASGGIKGAGSLGGNGGSGGGDYQHAGGNDGGNGEGTKGGTGQGTTTREFGESTTTEYAGGGNGNAYSGTHADGGGGTGEHPSGYPNTGGGGCGRASAAGDNSGGAGIVIIRNARGV